MEYFHPCRHKDGYTAKVKLGSILVRRLDSPTNIKSEADRGSVYAIGHRIDDASETFCFYIDYFSIVSKPSHDVIK